MSDQGRRGPEPARRTAGGAREGVGRTYVRRFFALCSGELSGFSAPPDASALDVFKAALSAGQSNGVVCAFSRMKEG